MFIVIKSVLSASYGFSNEKNTYFSGISYKWYKWNASDLN